jgi:hypothetical protein
MELKRYEVREKFSLQTLGSYDTKEEAFNRLAFFYDSKMHKWHIAIQIYDHIEKVEI